MHQGILHQALSATVDLLARDIPLPAQLKDHPLKGQWAPNRECHLRPDLLLVYRKPDDETLTLIRLGSHSELFG